MIQPWTWQRGSVAAAWEKVAAEIRDSLNDPACATADKCCKRYEYLWKKFKKEEAADRGKSGKAKGAPELAEKILECRRLQETLSSTKTVRQTTFHYSRLLDACDACRNCRKKRKRTRRNAPVGARRIRTVQRSE